MTTTKTALVRFRSYLVRFLDESGVCRTGEGLLNNTNTHIPLAITSAKCFQDGKAHICKI